MSENDKKSDGKIDPLMAVSPAVALAADALAKSDFVKSGKAAEVRDAAVKYYVENAPANVVAAKAGQLLASANELVSEGKVSSGVGVIGYGAVHAGAKINEAIGLSGVNDLQIKVCDDNANIPVIGTLSAPGCHAVKDVVAKRGK